MENPIFTRHRVVFDEIMDTNNTPDDMNEPHDTSGESSSSDEPTRDDLAVEGDALLEEAERLDDTLEIGDAVGESADTDDQSHEEPIEAGISGGGSSPPPPFQQVPVEDRLVRDPHATFGGVLSGIAHRYGWDVSLTRLGFLILVLTTVVPFFVYFVAWLVIPRATMWPPVGPSRSRGTGSWSSRLSGRDLGIGLLGLAVLVALAIGSGDATAIIVPIALIGAGIWLLTQSPREELATVGTPATSTEGIYGVPLGAPVAGRVTAPATPIVQFPVEGSRRGRRALKFGLIGLFLVILILLALIPLIILGGVLEGDINLDNTSRRVTIEDEVPAQITQDVGDLVIDFGSFEFSEDVEVLEVDLDLGGVDIIVPDDVRVRVDATAGAGVMNILGQEADGLDATVVIAEDNPQLILDVRVDLGDIDVVRSSDVGTAGIPTDIETEERS